MYYSTTIFNQILAFVPKDCLQRFVGQHHADRYVKKMTVWNQFVILMYAQATGKDSLREIETGLKTHEHLWYHLGVQAVSKSSLARANCKRSYKIFEDLFYAILKQCRSITPQRQFSFDNPLYSLDSTTIRLCLSLCDWAAYQHTKGAVKMHVLLNNRTDIPEVLTVTEGSVNDVRVARQLDVSIPRGSFLVFDRGYLDFKWWNTLHAHGIFFVTRPKKPTLFVVSGQQADSGGHILADERGWIGNVVHARYPREVRRVRYLNEDGETYEYVTNNFELSGEEIALIYKERWRIELFFKWIKQNLKIKSFLGTSPNAVLSQIWVAMIYYLILSYVKFQTKFDRSLLELSRMVKETLFTRRTIIDLLSLSPQTVYKFRVPEVFQLRLAGV
jgi:hypothetical protein